MKKYAYQIQETVQDLDLEMAAIMRKVKAHGFDNVIIELTPNGYSVMASVSLFDVGNLYTADVHHDGNITVGGAA